VHFIMLVKSWSPELALYAVVTVALLAGRLLLRRRRATAPRAGAANRAARA
jgi:DMSO/TMAO reductase YedYZ heme-binding membrane subunit